MKDGPGDLTSLNTDNVNVLHVEWPVPARGAWAIRPGAVNNCENSCDFSKKIYVSEPCRGDTIELLLKDNTFVLPIPY